MARDDRPTDDLKARRRGKAPTITLEAQEIVPAAEPEAPVRGADPSQAVTEPAPDASGETIADPAAETAAVSAAASTADGDEMSPGAGMAESPEADASPSPRSAVDAELSRTDSQAPPDAAGATSDTPVAEQATTGPIPLVTGGADPAPAPEPAATAPSPQREEPAAAAPAAPAGAGFGRLVAAGLVGALLTGGLAVGAQMAGYWPVAGARQGDAGLEQRLAALDSQVRQIASRPAATAVGAAPAAVDLTPVNRRIEALDAARASLETRLAALEQRPSTTDAPPPAVPAVDLSPLQTEIDALKVAIEAVAAAQKATPPAPPPVPEPTLDLGAVDARIAAATAPQIDRIAALGAAVQSLEAELKGVAASGAAVAEKVAALDSARMQAGDASRRAALVVGIGALRAAVDRGQAFAPELRTAAALGLSAEATGILQPHAERGLPGTLALAQRFAALAPALVRAAPGPAADGTLLDRLTASAQSLVRIRPIGEAAGDDVPTVVARIEAKLRRSDLAGALTDFDRLPEPVRALGADWAAEARARAAVDDALRRLSADAASALSGG